MLLKHFSYIAVILISLFSVSLSSASSSDNATTSDNAVNSESSTSETAINSESESNIHWQRCSRAEFKGWLDNSASNDLECAVLDIALTQLPQHSANTSNATDDVQPTTIQLAVSRARATGPESQKIGTLITVSGGPGQSGLDVSPIDSVAYKRLSRYFDIIGYAPRGVYPSTPTIECEGVFDDADKDLTELKQEFVDACWEQTPHALMSQLGGTYAIEDIEAIRRAIAEPQINLIGYSYGTKIATMYAEKYPQHLRAAVLDGLVNVNESDTQMTLNQAKSMQNTFERFVDWCHLQYSCYFDDVDTLQKAEQKLANLHMMLERKHIKGNDGERIYPNDLKWEIGGLLMWSDYWPILNSLLQELEEGDYSYLRLLIDYSEEDIDIATFISINCASYAPNELEKKTYLKKIKRISSVSTWDNYRKLSNAELLDSCYYWPVAGSDPPHVPSLDVLLPPLLLVAQTNDPATPYANAVAMQQYLDGILITKEGDGHTLALVDDSKCVDKKVVEYLVNPNGFADKHPDKHLTCR